MTVFIELEAFKERKRLELLKAEQLKKNRNYELEKRLSVDQIGLSGSVQKEKEPKEPEILDEDAILQLCGEYYNRYRNILQVYNDYKQ